MIDIAVWMTEFAQKLEDAFGDRVGFIGLQGSYARGEATQNSDIDVVVIFDELLPQDIRKYGELLDTMPYREYICGFISGKQELLNWERADLFQFYYDTSPFKGSLDELLPLIDESAVRRAIRLGAGNIYHGCVHNMLHGKQEDAVRGLYKAASFVLQAVAYLQTGRYISRQTELLEVLAPEDRCIAETFISLKQGGKVAFDEMSEALFAWAKHKI